MPEFQHLVLSDILSAMAPVTLAEMDGVKLMNRIDSKYVTTEAKIRQVLKDAAEAGYRVLETEGERISPYDSVYYDTPSLDMFRDHRNGRLVRQKVRTRCYVLSGTAFLEIKRKNNKGRTRKKRMEIPSAELMDFRGDASARGYLEQHSDFSAPMLEPVLETLFRRITLVNPSMTERLTIDTCLGFKQDGRAASRMKQILLRHRIHPLRVSKYCVAVALTDTEALPGRFKLKIRQIEKIIDHSISRI